MASIHCICLFPDIAGFESKSHILLDCFLDYNKEEELCFTGKGYEMKHYRSGTVPSRKRVVNQQQYIMGKLSSSH